MVGPGWLVMLADVDAPSILTAMQSGYYLGYAMIPWLLILTIPLYFIQELTIRAALGSGKGMGELLKESYGAPIAFLSLIAMLLIDGAAYIGEYASIAAIGIIFGIPVVVSIALTLVFHTGIIAVGGSYKRVENTLIAVSAFILIYLVAFAVIPIGIHGLTQSFINILIPSTYYDSEYVALLTANVGAVIMPWMLYYQQSAIVDKGLRREHYTHERFETAMGAVMSEALMVSALIVGYWLRVKGGYVDGFQEALLSIYKLISPYWFIAASIGMAAAALLAIFVISMGFAYGLSEHFGWARGFSRSPREAWRFYLFYAVEIVPAALIVLFMRNLTNLILDIMIFNSLALSIPLILLIRVTSRKDLVGEYAIGRARAIALYVVAALIVGIGLYTALTSLIA